MVSKMYLLFYESKRYRTSKVIWGNEPLETTNVIIDYWTLFVDLWIKQNEKSKDWTNPFYENSPFDQTSVSL